jgi:uncharacterized membrane protein YkvI
VSAGLKAAKIATIAVLCVAGFGAAVFGAYYLINELFGTVGLIVAWVLMAFAVFWLCALLDIRAQGRPQ